MKDRTRIRGVAIAAVVGALVVVFSTSASAVTRTLANWQMNEGRGASVMHDDGPYGIDGSIGSAVQTGVRSGSNRVYRWPPRAQHSPPAPQRLVRVDDSRLNPGTSDFAITIRFRTSRSFGNMIQKGQSRSPGGYFKWQIPNGNLTCLVRGRSPSGQTLSEVVHSGARRLNDGQWHTVRCERTANRVTMTVDGTFTRRAIGPTGSVSNNVPLTIGGKLNCDQVRVGCDYFVGEIDYVRIQVA